MVFVAVDGGEKFALDLSLVAGIGDVIARKLLDKIAHNHIEVIGLRFIQGLQDLRWMSHWNSEDYTPAQYWLPSYE